MQHIYLTTPMFGPWYEVCPVLPAACGRYPICYSCFNVVTAPLFYYNNNKFTTTTVSLGSVVQHVSECIQYVTICYHVVKLIFLKPILYPLTSYSKNAFKYVQKYSLSMLLSTYFSTFSFSSVTWQFISFTFLDMFNF